MDLSGSSLVNGRGSMEGQKKPVNRGDPESDKSGLIPRAGWSDKSGEGKASNVTMRIRTEIMTNDE